MPSKFYWQKLKLGTAVWILLVQIVSSPGFSLVLTKLQLFWFVSICKAKLWTEIMVPLSSWTPKWCLHLEVKTSASSSSSFLLIAFHRGMVFLSVCLQLHSFSYQSANSLGADQFFTPNPLPSSTFFSLPQACLSLFCSVPLPYARVYFAP